jgi:hypothetical protein
VNNLTSFNVYEGPGRLQVDNDSHLLIQNLAHCTLFSSNSFLNLNDVKHIPYITKNLISISKLTKDNDIILEFHPLVCIVKDHPMKQSLLQATKINGLY